MTDYADLPTTWYAMVRDPVETRTKWHRLSFHAPDGDTAIAIIETLFPGVDTKPWRDLKTGVRKPSVGINGNLSLINSDNFTPPPGQSDRRTKRLTSLQCLHSLNECIGSVNDSLTDVVSRMVQSTNVNNPVPKHAYIAWYKMMVPWAKRLASKAVLDSDEIFTELRAQRTEAQFEGAVLRMLESRGVPAPAGPNGSSSAPPLVKFKPEWPYPPGLDAKSGKEVTVAVKPAIEEVYLLPASLRPAVTEDDEPAWGAPRSLRDIGG